MGFKVGGAARWASIGVAAALAIAVVVVSSMLVTMRSERDRVEGERASVAEALRKAETALVEREVATPDTQRAEEIATRYAVGAATVDYRDLDSYAGRLKAGTTVELSAKLEATIPKLRGILAPLQWVSIPTLVAAKVMKAADGVFTVDVFLDLSTTNAQSSQPDRSTIYYVVTVDRGAQWQITDVGGTGAHP